MKMNLTNQSANGDKVLHVHVAMNEPSKMELLEQSMYKKNFSAIS